MIKLIFTKCVVLFDTELYYLRCKLRAMLRIQVWASKWNERAYFSTKKVGLDHEYLCMAVLVQEIVNADYAFVIHTTNPSSGDSSEIYAEVMQY